MRTLNTVHSIHKIVAAAKDRMKDWSIAYKELLPNSTGMHGIGHQRMEIGS